MNDIGKGEEITIDYSLTEDEKSWTMICKCGAKNCRKIIKSIHYLPSNLFKKYKPFIPNYFKGIREQANKVKF